MKNNNLYILICVFLSFNLTKLNAQIFPEVVIGQTFYDLQTNGSVPTRIINHGDGTLSTTWTFSAEPGTPWSDRGMAYHFFNGTNWVSNPNYQDANNISRVDAARTGFGSIGRVAGVGDIIVAHQTAVDALQVNINPNTNATQAWSSTAVTSMPLLWPRIAVGGPDGKTVHAIALTEPSGGTFTGAPFNGINGAMLYNRSTNGGVTWGTTMVALPGIDSTIFSSMSGDSYAIDAKGNTVAIVAGESNSRVMLWKSTDNGQTWDTTKIWSFPYEPWDDSVITDFDGDGDVDSFLVNGNYELETIPVSDGAYSILIDNNNKVHVWFGAMQFSNDSIGDGIFSFYPGTSGILYWNEDFGTDSLTSAADLVDDDGNGTYDVSTSYAAIGSISGPVPYGSGLTTFPSAGIDADGNLYLIYSGAKEGLQYSADGTEPSRKHIYAIKSIDGGATWSTPIDLVGDENAGFDQLKEYAYPSLAKNVDGYLHMIYQTDIFPGSAVTINNTTFHPFDLPSDIVYLKVSRTLEAFTLGSIAGSGIVNGNPNTISIATQPTGCPSFSYQWYSFNGITSAPTGSSTNGWTLIPGATSSSYDPPTLFQSTTFACFVTPSAGCGTLGWAQGVATFNLNGCNIDPQYQGALAGIYPDTLTNLPIALPNINGYNASLQIVSKADTLLPINLTGQTLIANAYIQSTRINSIQGLPDGFFWTPNETIWTNGGVAPNFTPTQGCINIDASQFAIQNILNSNPEGAEFPLEIILDYKIASTDNSLANLIINNAWLSELTALPGINAISILGYKIKVLPNLLGSLSSVTIEIQAGFNPTTLTFSTAPSGCPSYSYQWYSFNGITTAPTGSSTNGWTIIPGATSSSYDPPTLFQSTTFACFVTPSTGCGTPGWAQGAASFTITSSAGQVNSTSVQQCGNDAVALSFNNLPNGLGNASYQWYVQNGNVACPQGNSTLGWQILIGANTANASFTPPGNGIYTLACLVTPEAITGLPAQWANGCKSVVTSSYTAQSIIGNPNITPFSPYTYLVSEIIGNTYTWQVTGGAISSGQNTNQVVVIWASTGPYLLQLIESDGICTDTSSLSIQGSSCALAVNAVAVDPSTFCNGQSARLVANAPGNVSYQWQLNGAVIPGASNDTLLAEQSGSYQVVATLDANCSAISLPVALTELPPLLPPGINVSGNSGNCNSEPATLSATGNFSYFVWSTGEGGASIFVNESGSYSVTGYDAFSCSAQSPPQEVNLALLPPVNVCVVSVDSLTGRNIIVWEKPQTTLIDSFVVFRESVVADVYEPIGTQAYSEFSTFIDPVANPLVQATRYKLGLVDTCGTLSTTSPFHKTIHLTLNLGVGGTVNLIWSGYEGLSFGSYKIYRGTSPDAMSELVTIQSNLNSYTDLTPPAGTVYYQIGIVVPLCNPTAFGFEQSRSNVANTGSIGMEDLTERAIRIYPNPSGDVATIETDENSTGTYRIFDLSGRMVRKGQLMGRKTSVSLLELPAGIYVLSMDENPTVRVKMIKQ